MTLLKLTSPGVPDIYQGDEVPFLALVDPDNRRPVDWEALRRQLASSEPPAKLDLIRRTLALRARRAARLRRQLRAARRRRGRLRLHPRRRGAGRGRRPRRARRASGFRPASGATSTGRRSSCSPSVFDSALDSRGATALGWLSTPNSRLWHRAASGSGNGDRGRREFQMSNGAVRLTPSRPHARALLFGVAALIVCGRSSRLRAPRRWWSTRTRSSGLTVTQNEGFATLAWEPVAGATDYQIERTPVDAANVPTGAAVIVGVWQPIRTVTPAVAAVRRGRLRARRALPVARPRPLRDDEPAAVLRARLRHDPSAVGHRARRRPAHRLGDERQRDVHDATRRRSRTRRRSTPPATAFRFVELGRTNPTIGPTARPATGRSTCSSSATRARRRPPRRSRTGRRSSTTATSTATSRRAASRASSSRACSRSRTDPHLLEILSNVTVLIVPTINGNGRAGNDRGNETDADLNRDHALLRQPETLAFATVLRDYTPDIGARPARGRQRGPADPHVAAPERLRAARPRGQGRPRRGLDVRHRRAEPAGGTARTAPAATRHEGILRNTFGLKNVLGMLAENRASGGNTRPAEGTQLANRNRKSYGSLWEEFNTLEYFWTNLAMIRGDRRRFDRVPERERRPDRAPRLVPVGPPPALPGPRPAGLRRRPGGQPGPVAAEPVDEREHEGHGLRQPGADHRAGAVRLLRHRDAVLRARCPGIGPPLAVRLDAHGVAQETRPSGTSSGSLSRCAA